MKTAKKIGTIVVSVILWIIILLAALFAFTTLATRNDSNVASIAGFTPMTVQTDSMVPTFSSGDLIIIKKCDPDTLEVGDIVTFHTIIENQYALNTHRIAEIDEDDYGRSYVTKGDNNLIEDQHVIQDGDIVGKYVCHIPKLGTVMDFLSSSIGFLVVIVLPLLLFFIYQIYHLVMVSISLKKATAIENAQAAAEAAAAAGVTAAPAAPPADTTEADAMRAEAEKAKAEAEAALAEAKRIKAEAEAAKAKAEAEAALAEAKRIKAEAEAALAQAKGEAADPEKGDNE